MLNRAVCNVAIKDERFRPNLIFFECLNRLICDYYRPQTKLRKGRGRYTSPGRHPPGETSPPGQTPPPWADTYL